VDWNVSPRLTLTWDAFAGNEQPDGARARLRQFHEGIVRFAPDARTTLSAALDYGRQPRLAAGAGTASWRGFAVVARRALTPTLAVAGRWEGYSDPEQVIVATGQAEGLRAMGGSVNVDVALHPKALWRTEARTLGARSALFPARDGAFERRDLVLVTALALTF
jgi:hypothetical protein